MKVFTCNHLPPITMPKGKRDGVLHTAEGQQALHCTLAPNNVRMPICLQVHGLVMMVQNRAHPQVAVLICIGWW